MGSRSAAWCWPWRQDRSTRRSRAARTVEAFAGSDGGQRIAQRIRAAGGTLQVIALDEPWYFGHVYSGPNACNLSVEEVARGVADFVAAVRAEFPWVIVGDIEPSPQPVSVSGLTEWMDAYASAVGEPMAFLHLDLDWSQTTWSDLALAVEGAGGAKGIPVGIIYTGGAAPADEQWIRLAGQRVLDHEVRDGGTPDHVIFQSWNDHPDFVLPEAGEYTFTGFVNQYFDDRASLGLGGPGGNPRLAQAGHRVQRAAGLACRERGRRRPRHDLERGRGTVPGSRLTWANWCR